ncbi:MAG: hypothetical protein AABZ30_08780 [Myxococcota bacterium]
MRRLAGLLVALTGCDATAENDLDGDAEPAADAAVEDPGALPQKECEGDGTSPVLVDTPAGVVENGDGRFESDAEITLATSSRWDIRFLCDDCGEGFVSFPAPKGFVLSFPPVGEAVRIVAASRDGGKGWTPRFYARITSLDGELWWEGGEVATRGALLDDARLSLATESTGPTCYVASEEEKYCCETITPLAVTVDADATATVPEGEVEDVAVGGVPMVASSPRARSVRCGPGSADCDYDGGEAFLARIAAP